MAAGLHSESIAAAQCQFLHTKPELVPLVEGVSNALAHLPYFLVGAALSAKGSSLNKW